MTSPTYFFLRRCIDVLVHGTYLNVQVHTTDQDRLGLHRWLTGQ